MKPIKCWVAQDGKLYSYGEPCAYLYMEKPNFNPFKKAFNIQKNMVYAGKRLLKVGECIECVIITEKEYERLLKK